jgi:hypothetical protein
MRSRGGHECEALRSKKGSGLIESVIVDRSSHLSIQKNSFTSERVPHGTAVCRT